MSATDDAALVEKVIAGEVEAYGELMERYEAKLLRYVTYLLGGDYASADAVQETFIKAYTNLRSYKPQYPFSAWIYRIAHNTAITLAKKNRHMQELPEGEAADRLPEMSIPDRMADDVDSSLLGDQLNVSLAALPLKYREPLVLNLVEGYSYQEVAEILNLPINTVATRIRRAKQQAQAHLRTQGVHS